ncbi:MAG: four helix bundle protein [Bacteroidota bacterium]|nr:four helix bundle protein [Bacteroidota bacterium]
MNDRKENIIVQKIYAFALAIVQIYKPLTEKREFILSKQLLRSGTSIGANVHEAVSGKSKKDFHKMGIATKEACETSYWLHLLNDSGYITPGEFSILNNSCNVIIKILSSIILATKERHFTNS